MNLEARTSSRKWRTIPAPRARLLDTAVAPARKKTLWKRYRCIYKWSRSGRNEPKANKNNSPLEKLPLTSEHITKADTTCTAVYTALPLQVAYYVPIIEPPAWLLH